MTMIGKVCCLACRRSIGVGNFMAVHWFNCKKINELVAREERAERRARRLDNVTKFTFDQYVNIAGRTYLVHLLERCDGNMAAAARIAGYNRTHFYKLLERFRLRVDDYRPEAPLRSPTSLDFDLWRRRRHSPEPPCSTP
jgi:DNA-binding NtrC family response regulator